MKKISFVIRVRNEIKDIRKTIESIRRQKSNEYELEIIIVDNMSKDGTVESICDIVDKIIYISEEEFSWGRAINKGVINSEGEYIILISGHCILRDNTIQNSINLMKSNNISVLYGKQFGDEKKDKIECIELIERCPEINVLPFYEHKKGVGVSNAACIFLKSIWDNNKFDEDLQSAEDAEWCNRIRKQGVRCGYSNVFEVQHGHYFNAEYVYKKWFWRTKIVDKMRNPKLIKLLSTRVFLFMKILLITFRYYKKNMFLKNKIKLISVFYYSIIMELPRYNARKNLYINEEVKYEDIKVPKMIYNLGKKIERYEKYFDN